MAGLSLGILVDNALKQQYLGNMVVQAGHRIGYSSILSVSAPPDLTQQVDAWVVDLVEPDEGSDEAFQLAIMTVLDNLLEQVQAPVIVNEGIAFHQGSIEHQDWVR